MKVKTKNENSLHKIQHKKIIRCYYEATEDKCMYSVIQQCTYRHMWDTQALTLFYVWCIKRLWKIILIKALYEESQSD